MADATEYKSNTAGEVEAFKGLADGTYTLVEKTVPAGYNKAADVNFTIAKGDYTVKNLEQKATVVNKPGTELPKTGGLGTMLLTLVGSILVIGVGVLIVTKKRMSAK
ncbi:SpaA isopeptide-forming pilin-related protein [Streptococcus intermedius]|uniref:SpaA isopeptide-forming pilin-related protein n=1 Tax=Streptococcus intermedius TaxID=1338 RepID=UPI0020A451CB|nr:SpaA isopeptide-forming pilin-related protein [Streptococcus intermedius]